jgi:hypothetical protein
MVSTAATSKCKYIHVIKGTTLHRFMLSYNSCTVVKIIDEAPLYSLLKNSDNLWLKSPYT